jgi:hypothetical protein
MILPTKHLRQDRALLTVGAEILALLSEPKTVSRIWEELKRSRSNRSGLSLLTYDWFVLSLDLLFLLHAIDLQHGRLRRIQS